MINYALAIPKNVYGEHIASLPHERLSTLQYRLKYLKLIITDEISMVSNKMLKHIHERLKQIFGSPDSMLFSGISLITVGTSISYHQLRQSIYFQNTKMIVSIFAILRVYHGRISDMHQCGTMFVHWLG